MSHFVVPGATNDAWQYTVSSACFAAYEYFKSLIYNASRSGCPNPTQFAQLPPNRSIDTIEWKNLIKYAQGKTIKWLKPVTGQRPFLTVLVFWLYKENYIETIGAGAT